MSLYESLQTSRPRHSLHQRQWMSIIDGVLSYRMDFCFEAECVERIEDRINSGDVRSGPRVWSASMIGSALGTTVMRLVVWSASMDGVALRMSVLMLGYGGRR